LLVALFLQLIDHARVGTLTTWTSLGKDENLIESYVFFEKVLLPAPLFLGVRPSGAVTNGAIADIRAPELRLTDKPIPTQLSNAEH
jgi:hypothetical protein